jgi:hypothetical protein
MSVQKTRLPLRANGIERHAKSSLVLLGLLFAGMLLLVVSACDSADNQTETSSIAQCAKGEGGITTSTQVIAGPDNPPEGNRPMEQTIIYYSGPRLDMEPRKNVNVTVSINQPRAGDVVAQVGIRNRSESAFRFSVEDLRFYVNCNRLELKSPQRKVLEVPATAEGYQSIDLTFNAPDFDPSGCGLIYVCSDPASVGFTQSAGASARLTGVARQSQ